MRLAWWLLVIGGVAVGCSTTARQPDGSVVQFKWLQGELKTAVANPLPRVDQAARDALDELGMVGIDGDSNAATGRLSALMADGTPVRIKLAAAGTGNCFIRIKVGTIGDKAISLQILRHIQQQLAVADER